MSYKLTQVEAYVPTCYPDGEPIPARTRASVLDALAAVFGGVTVIPACEGRWVDPSTHTTVKEPIEIWRTLVHEYSPNWWGEWAKRLLVLFRQDTFLVTAVEVDVVEEVN